MSYWDDDAEQLKEIGALLYTLDRPALGQRLLDIARDMERTPPDAEFLEDLAVKIQTWVDSRVLPTPGFADEISHSLYDISLLLKKHPGA